MKDSTPETLIVTCSRLELLKIHIGYARFAVRTNKIKSNPRIVMIIASN
jgi:hypothetical protein